MTKVSYVIIACYPDKGMKSYGSKSLLEFSKKKLLEYQIECIKSTYNNEIIVISDFETSKLQKYFGDQAKIISLANKNPIYTGCSISNNDHVVFIDYGCLFKKNILKHLSKDALVITNNNKNIKLDVGCIAEKNEITHMFLDLPEHKFCNIFSITPEYRNLILQTDGFDYFNLLSFEIINMLINLGAKFKIHSVDNRDFLFFNHMRQKNAVSKFIKNTTN